MGKKSHQNSGIAANSARKEHHLIERDLVVGNFWAARKLARKLAAESEANGADLALAQRTLRLTWPDTIAILIGLLVSCFSLGVGFWAAY